MKDKCVVSFADEAGNYRKAMDRLKMSLDAVGFDGDFLGFTSYDEIGSPPHKGSDDAVPYAFKAYALQKAIDLGYEKILWCDSVVYATKPIDHVFEHLSVYGYLFFDNIGFSIGDYTSDACLEKFGMSRQEAFDSKMWMACCFGININRGPAEWFASQYINAAKDGVSYMGDWFNNENQVSKDSRVKGHRHDQSAGAIIIKKNNLKLTNAQEKFFAYVSHKGILPIGQQVSLWSEGI
jgi:hypothetical protein